MVGNAFLAVTVLLIVKWGLMCGGMRKEVKTLCVPPVLAVVFALLYAHVAS